MAKLNKIERPKYNNVKRGGGEQARYTYTLIEGKRTRTKQTTTSRIPFLDYSNTTLLYCRNCSVKMMHILTGKLAGKWLCGLCGMTITEEEKRFLQGEIKDELHTKSDLEDNNAGIVQREDDDDSNDREDWASKEIRRDIEKDGKQVVSIS